MKIRLLIKDKSYKDSDSGLAYYVGSDIVFSAILQVSNSFDKETGEYIDWEDVELHSESEDY